MHNATIYFCMFALWFLVMMMRMTRRNDYLDRTLTLIFLNVISFKCQHKSVAKKNRGYSNKSNNIEIESVCEIRYLSCCFSKLEPNTDTHGNLCVNSFRRIHGFRKCMLTHLILFKGKGGNFCYVRCEKMMSIAIISTHLLSTHPN